MLVAKWFGGFFRRNQLWANIRMTAVVLIQVQVSRQTEASASQGNLVHRSCSVFDDERERVNRVLEAIFGSIWVTRNFEQSKRLLVGTFERRIVLASCG